ncbi:MAG: hypothetical protein C4547_07125, partial [Phycisphaerales bacterium]
VNCGAEYSLNRQIQYSRARWYNPDLGRWMQRDPLEFIDALDLYLALHASPLVILDPSGGQTLTKSEVCEKIQCAARPKCRGNGTIMGGVWNEVIQLIRDLQSIQNRNKCMFTVECDNTCRIDPSGSVPAAKWGGSPGKYTITLCTNCEMFNRRVNFENTMNAAFLHELIHVDSKCRDWRSGEEDPCLDFLAHEVRSLYCSRQCSPRGGWNKGETEVECIRRLVRDVYPALHKGCTGMSGTEIDNMVTRVLRRGLACPVHGRPVQERRG